MNRNLRTVALICLVFFTTQMSVAQSLQLLTSGRKTSIRGLSVVDDEVAWVSGSQGTVGRTTDGGRSWTWHVVAGFSQTDFRDIEAFDARTAVIMGISSPGYILKTTDGGATWKTVYADSSRGIFLDAMDFLPDGSGIVIGDPIDGRMYQAVTSDRGDSWVRTNGGELPALAEGEAFFASSGTNIRIPAKGPAFIVTGGMRSRLIVGDRLREMPILQGGQSTGANSLAVWEDGGKSRIVVVGGDFARDTLRTQNCLLSKDGGRTWRSPGNSPHGYRSSVEFLSRKSLIACGTSGVDISDDGGRNWKLISRDGYHVCRKARNGSAIYLAGSNGRIARLVTAK
jgi:photosystem II stability/assembly factor-like uncharacterized protein